MTHMSARLKNFQKRISTITILALSQRWGTIKQAQSCGKSFCVGYRGYLLDEREISLSPFVDQTYSQL